MTIQQVADVIVARSDGRGRYMVAIAGPPGAGKSTLAHELVQRLPPGSAKAVPLDGFHYDNAVLDRLGLRARKGAPETFDCAGVAALLGRIRRSEPDIAIPLFDRDIDLARAGADVISKDVKSIVIEGNYLLLNEPPWTNLAEYFDLTLYLDVPRPELERRLMQRWLDLGDSQQKAEHWVASNDMPNVDRVMRHRREADLTL